jgi:glycosyltransferase involved in cell wall biosynthesis
MRLVILHYHLRPGGVRRVIELATPYFIREFGGEVQDVVVATGEPPDSKWEILFRRVLAPIPLKLFIASAFRYLSEQKRSPSRIRNQIREALEKLFRDATPENTLIWAHNLGVARNLLLSHELGKLCAARGLRFASHHHDWWFDNRWRRWREMRRYGFRTLQAGARAIFPAGPTVRHLAINRADASRLNRRLAKRAGWLPNLAERGKAPGPQKVRAAKDWLQQQLPASARKSPIWLLPCRMLRRKNIAEALLLTRWLRPEAWLVTTGGASSADERAYYQALNEGARRNGWPLRLGVLQGDETHKPSVAELLGASEAVLLTSIQEGFGLPYLEAAAANRPLIARIIPNIAPDLAEFGFEFPQSYREILVAPSLFDYVAERRRQEKLYRKWRQALPRAARLIAQRPALLTAENQPRPLPFSRLTLNAQLEILSHAAEKSWLACSPLNPFLNDWRERATAGRLRLTRWPQTADKWLSGPSYARRIRRIIFSDAETLVSPYAAIRLQCDFLRENVRADHLFPLLWEA